MGADQLCRESGPKSSTGGLTRRSVTVNDPADRLCARPVFHFHGERTELLASHVLE